MCQLREPKVQEGGNMSERYTIIKYTTPEGEVVDKVIFNLHGLSTEEAAKAVWAVFQELGWVSE